MKILRCLNCEKAVVLSEYDCNAVVKCTECGYTDYAYAYTSFHHRYRREGNTSGLTELLPLFKEEADKLMNSGVDVSVLIADLARRYGISPVSVAAIINAYIAGKDSVPDPVKEKYFFAEYCGEQVSVEKLYNELLAIQRERPDNRLSAEMPVNYEMELRSLKVQLSEANKQLADLQQYCKKVGALLRQYKTENSTLKGITSETPVPE